MRALPCLLCLFVAPALAAEPASLPRDPGERLQREQLEQARKRVLERSATDLAPQAVPADAYGDAPEVMPEPGPTFQIDSIAWTGERLLSESDFKRIVAPFKGKRLGVNRINLLLDRINRALVAEGYITARAYVANQSLNRGVLTLTVVPGHIEKILYNGAPLARKDWNQPGVRLALPMRAGDLLRLPDIEQAVDQLNRLRRNKVQVQIRPGEQPGGSVVEFSNRRGKAANYRVTADNQGASGTGLLRLQGTMETGDVLGLMESAAIGLTTSRETNAVHGTLAVPLGYATATAMASWSEYQNLIGDTALVYGDSNSLSLGLNWLLHRDRVSKTAGDVTLIRRHTERWINNARLTPQTHTVLRVGINRLSRIETRAGLGQWTWDVGVSRGLGWFGADRDPDDLLPEAAHAQFTKYEFSAGGALPLGHGLAWRPWLTAQWSDRPLFSSEQLFAGGVTSVRGFSESAVGGDRGALLRNELVYEALRPIWRDRIRLEPYLFLDGASVESRADGHGETLAGIGLGLRIGFGGGQAELTVGTPLHTPASLPEAGPRVNFSIAYQF